MSDSPDPIAVLVLGMHRSGTSALTRFIGQLGATLPNDPLGGQGSAGDNPAGFWESLRVIGQNETLLHAAGSTWFDTAPLRLDRLDPAQQDAHRNGLAEALFASFEGADCFVVKEPRICRMVPFYREVLAGLGVEPRAVLMLRDPGEVAASLAARNQISAGYAGLLWAQHLIEAERHTRDLPRVVLAYDDLLGAPLAAADRLCRLIGRTPPAGLNVATTLRPDLRHHKGGGPAFAPALEAALHALHTAALALRDQDGATQRAELDAAASGFARLDTAMRDLAAAEYAFHRLTLEAQGRRPREAPTQRRAFATAMERLQFKALSLWERVG
jgi:hypothetical protein